MSGRRTMVIKAPVHALKLTEENGYQFMAKIKEGPENLVDRLVVVPITADQLNAIADWQPEGNFGRLDLENIKPVLIPAPQPSTKLLKEQCMEDTLNEICELLDYKPDHNKEFSGDKLIEILKEKLK
jgi:hypothetical protein